VRQRSNASTDSERVYRVARWNEQQAQEGTVLVR
jgi:hypothetical protein